MSLTVYILFKNIDTEEIDNTSYHILLKFVCYFAAFS